MKELRGDRQWSQAQVAEMLEVSRQSVNAIETGKYDPSLPLAMRIARLFRTRVDEIFLDGPTVKEVELRERYETA
jgi:putative transcriptional regulator